MSNQTRYPLCWPEGWPRTVGHMRHDSPFIRPVRFSARGRSMDEATRGLAYELRLLRAAKEVLSTNVKLRLDGAPYSNQAQPSDPGAAVYFELKGKSVSLACDKWRRVECNIWAMVKHIEALRGQQRWGVGTIDQAFRGYTALPAIGQAGGIKWWETLGVPINSTADQVKDAHRILLKKTSPGRRRPGPNSFTASRRLTISLRWRTLRTVVQPTKNENQNHHRTVPARRHPHRASGARSQWRRQADASRSHYPGLRRGDRPRPSTAIRSG